MFFIVFVFGLLLVGVEYIKPLIVYQPHPDNEWRLKTHLEHESVYLTTFDKQVLTGYFFRPSDLEKRYNQPTVLFFHGNGFNNANYVLIAEYFIHNLDVNFLLIDYRGYGNSTGVPSEHGLIIDAETAYDYLASRTDVGKIIVYGYSLGGAVAIALDRKPCFLALENTFTYLNDMSPIPWFFSLGWNSLDRIQYVSSPVLFLVGLADRIVPPLHSERLYAATQSPKQILRITNAEHGVTWYKGGQLYLDTWKAFMHKHCSV